MSSFSQNIADPDCPWLVCVWWDPGANDGPGDDYHYISGVPQGSILSVPALR